MKGNVVAGLSELHVTSPDEIINILHAGNRNRTTEPTKVNQVSSRSHAVL
jgi:kinesin family protein 18/19